MINEPQLIADRIETCIRQYLYNDLKMLHSTAIRGLTLLMYTILALHSMWHKIEQISVVIRTILTKA